MGILKKERQTERETKKEERQRAPEYRTDAQKIVVQEKIKKKKRTEERKMENGYMEKEETD